MDLVSIWTYLIHPAVYWTIAALAVLPNFYVLAREHGRQNVSNMYSGDQIGWGVAGIILAILLACGWPGGIPIVLGVLMFRKGIQHNEGTRSHVSR